jgi:Tfp pilus assembly protein PilO
MQLKLSNIDWKNNIVRYNLINSIILSAAGICLVAFAVYTYLAVSASQGIEDARQERSKLEGEISYFNLTKKLASDKVEGYNTLLLQLIPEQEDYFLLIASIERFSQRTGLKVDTYSVDVPKEGSDKFTMTITGSFAPNQLQRFLDNYQFGTGRLVTIENMSLTQNPNATIQPLDVRMTINLYSRKVSTSNLIRVGSLSQKDIDLMESISEKMKAGEQQGQVIQQELAAQEALKKLLEEQAAASAAAALTPTVTPRPQATPRTSPTRSAGITSSPTTKPTQ